jgi:hypothetical protein
MPTKRLGKQGVLCEISPPDRDPDRMKSLLSRRPSLAAARPSLGAALSAGMLALSLSSCHRTEKFESVCQIVRSEVVEVDEAGKPRLVDYEMEWDPCPGDQAQMVRGGAEFAACMAKYKPGDSVPVRVKHWWDTRGFYTWDVFEVGGCKREIEEPSEGSFEKSQECKDEKSYGNVNGFTCSRRPFARLVKVCPWLSRD